MPSPNPRFFIALPVPQTTQVQIAQFQTRLRHRFPWPISWERPEKLHLTLAFLNHLTPRQQSAILTLLDHQFSSPPPPSSHLIIDQLNFFTKHRTDIIVYLEILDPQHYLARLHQSLVNQLLKLGLSPSLKFTPHLTIARIKPRYHTQIGDLSQLTSQPHPDFIPIPIHLQLWQSQFSPRHNTTIYQPVSRSNNKP